MPEASNSQVDGSGATGCLCLWQIPPGPSVCPTGQVPETFGAPNGAYGNVKPPAKSGGAIGTPVGRLAGAGRGRLGKDGAAAIATGWSRTSSAGSSSETSGLAVSDI